MAAAVRKMGWRGEVRNLFAPDPLLDLTIRPEASQRAAAALANQAPVFSGPDFSILRVSTDAAGGQANATSGRGAFWLDGTPGAFSADGGSILFMSLATNLVPGGDTNGISDIFIKDLVTGAVTRVSTVPGNGGGANPFLSASAEQVFYQTNDGLLLRNVAAGTVTTVTSVVGDTAYGMSADGTRLLFGSASETLVPDDTNGIADIFIMNVVTGTIERVSTNLGGSMQDWQMAAFSPDGTKILFRTAATNLVPGDVGTVNRDFYVKDLLTGTYIRVSSAANGTDANADSLEAAFSPDGTKVIFTSLARNLVPGDTNLRADVFIKDLLTGAITRVSTSSTGGQLNAESRYGAFSPDGTKILFSSQSSNLVPGDTNGTFDIFIKDLLTGAVTRLSTTALDVGGNGSSLRAIFSPDGTQVLIESSASNLVLGDTNAVADLFVVTLGTKVAPYVEDAVPLQVATLVTLSDSDSANYAGGTLTVAITAGGVAGDRLALTPSAVAGAQIAVSGNEVSFNGTLVGTLTATDTSFSIALNANADDRTVCALAQAAYIWSLSQNPTDAVRTVTFTLVDGGGTAEGGHDAASFTREIAFVPVNDPAVARPDHFTVAENGTVSGNLFADNGSGADVDVDGPPLAIATIAFKPVVFDQPIVLDGGALLTVHADGSFTYDPNGAFDYVPAPDSGAMGHSPGFHYSLAGGNQVSASFTIIGVDSDDILFGTTGVDTMHGGIGEDELYGYGGADTLYGDDGDDFISGGVNDGAIDYLYGGAGNDTLGDIPGAGGVSAALSSFDFHYGGPGDDLYLLDNFNDFAIEAVDEGFDTIIAFASHTLYGSSEVELLVASPNTFFPSPIALTGNDFANQLVGNNQNNPLAGRGGDDLLQGGDGADRLTGGAGRDMLEGGDGADIFAFNLPSESPAPALRSDGAKLGPDVIRDFASGVDRINLSAIDAISATGSDDAFTFIGSGAFTGQAGQLRCDLIGGAMHIYGDVDGNGLADFEIVAMTPILQASDFIL